MATLFFGATKGLTGLMGMGALMFGLAMNRVEIQMDAVEVAPVEIPLDVLPQLEE